MQKTKNYGFNKPDRTDFINASDWATMMDQVDTELKKQEEYNKLAGMYIGGTELSAEAITDDTKARYNVIRKPSSTSAEVKVFEKEIALPQGLYSVMFRIKLSDTSGTENLISIASNLKSASGGIVPLKEVYIKPSAFDMFDTYQTFGFCIDKSGAKDDRLLLSMSLLASKVQTTISVDYVLISPSYTAITAIG